MQALYSMRTAPYPLDPTSNDHVHDRYSQAIEAKTYWACFIKDCMVNAGTYNPPMLPMSEMKKLKVGRPVNALEYALGQGTRIPSQPFVIFAEDFPVLAYNAPKKILSIHV